MNENIQEWIIIIIIIILIIWGKLVETAINKLVDSTLTLWAKKNVIFEGSSINVCFIRFILD